MADLHALTPKPEKQLNSYEVLSYDGELVLEIKAHDLGIEPDIEQYLFLDNHQDIIGVVPFGLIIKRI